jgi:hypothetical protein
MKKNFTLMLSLCCFLFSNTKAQTSTVNGVVKSQIDNNGNIFTNGKIAIGTLILPKLEATPSLLTETLSSIR